MTEAKSTASWFETTVVWTRRNPAAVFLGAAIIVTLIYFFGVVKIYLNGHLSTWTWAWQAWNPETNYEHAKLIPLIVGPWFSANRMPMPKAQLLRNIRVSCHYRKLPQHLNHSTLPSALFQEGLSKKDAQSFRLVWRGAFDDEWCRADSRTKAICTVQVK